MPLLPSRPLDPDLQAVLHEIDVLNEAVDQAQKLPGTPPEQLKHGLAPSEGPTPNG